MLSCSCPDYDGDIETWAFYSPEDFSKFEAKRRKRCCSCKKLINIGSDCLEFKRIRAPLSDIEERIMGEEVPISSLFMCESCGEIYLNLHDIGYCLDITEDMRENLKEYQHLTGFKKNDNQSLNRTRETASLLPAE